MSSKYVSYDIDPLTSTSVSAIGSILNAMNDQRRNNLSSDEIALKNATEKEKLSLDKWKASADIEQMSSERRSKEAMTTADRIAQVSTAAAERDAKSKIATDDRTHQSTMALEERILKERMTKEDYANKSMMADKEYAAKERAAIKDRAAQAAIAAAANASNERIAAADRAAQASRDNRAIAKDNAETARNAEQTAYNRSKDSKNDAEAKSDKDYAKSRDAKADKERDDQLKGELAGANATLDVPISTKVKVSDPKNAIDPDAINTEKEGVKELKNIHGNLVTDEQIKKLHLTESEKKLLDEYNAKNAIEDPTERANKLREMAVRGKSPEEIDKEDSGITSLGKTLGKGALKLGIGAARAVSDLTSVVAGGIGQSSEKYRKEQENITKNRKAQDKVIDYKFKKDDLSKDLVSRVEEIKKKDTDRQTLEEKAKVEKEALQKYKDTHGKRVIPETEIDRVLEPAETRAQGEQQINNILAKYAEEGASPNELLYAKKALAERLNSIVERQKELKKNESDEAKRQRDKQDKIEEENRKGKMDEKSDKKKSEEARKLAEYKHKLSMQEKDK